ncbi:stage III sporulation protein AF [Paraliobacillus ryukyuensis]|uniref:Stage III sporulation protein AF n=1 Tax=Paraliobacillus ryukyuensis TaxID=200904 RepID=A0A366EIX6_9BACI|nr:stage III sporulation protein AF [Paraliobacillus ryukyuensis]RBP01429.1 stage III sporulation protein AF [Paraliobacillus ryukyuensis]
MEFLVAWVTKLILFLFLTLILEMLLPQTDLRKYVHTVMSLLFLLMLLHPLFQLFHVDVNQVVSQSFNSFNQEVNEKQLEKNIESKKKEIQASQDAYIVEELIVQMKNQVKEELVEEYHVQIADIQLQFFADKSITPETLKTVTVYLHLQEPNTGQSEIKEVVIGNNQSSTEETITDNIIQEVSQFLADQWEIDADQLEIIQKGEV